MNGSEFLPVKGIAILFALAASAFQQNTVQPPTPPSYTVDCSTVNATLSCRSFNEMVEKKDPDLLSEIKAPSFVCFRSTEDVFSVVSPASAPDLVYYKETTKYLSQAGGVVFYNRYSSGIAEDSRIVMGNWNKFSMVNSEPSFESLKEGNTQASISSAELSVTYAYKNLSGSTTTYSPQVRRSTKRFLEMFQFPDDAPPTGKNKVPPEKPHGSSRVENTGYCAEFK
jgi:hypothetical protein